MHSMLYVGSRYYLSGLLKIAAMTLNKIPSIRTTDIQIKQIRQNIETSSPKP